MSKIRRAITQIKRAVMLIIIEVVNSNPNGDPDKEGDPRQRDDGRGDISPVSAKRKLRDLLEDHDTPLFRALPEKFTDEESRYNILVRRDRDANAVIKEFGDDPKKYLESEFVNKYWDARIFGNTFIQKVLSKGFLRTGAVQMSLGESIAPVNIIRYTNTSKVGTDSDKESGMAPLAYRVVEHGVYCIPVYINPNEAWKTGCTADDIELMKLLIPVAYDLTRSAIRPDVRIRHAWYVEHKSIFGGCPDHEIIEALTPKKLGDKNEPSKSWADYEDVTDLPDNLKARVASVTDLING